jgi:hypothetical protein
MPHPGRQHPAGAGPPSPSQGRPRRGPRPPRPRPHPVRPGAGGGHAPRDDEHPTRHATAARAGPSAGLGVRRGHIACRFPASSPREAEARGYGGVHPLDAEDPPKMFAMLAACAALTLVVMSLAVPREVEARRLARLRAAQEKWARELDRR